MKRTVPLLLALVLLLSACAKQEAAPVQTQSTTAATTQPTEAPKTVVTAVVARYSHKTEDWWRAFETEYEAANSDIDLVIECVPWNDIASYMQWRIDTGDLPDLLNIDQYRSYQADGLLLPAKQWVSEKTYGKFYEGLLNASAQEDTVWAVPDLVSARAVYYNTDLLAAVGVAVPTTWKELKSVCMAIRDYDRSLCPWGVDMTSDEGFACFAYYILNNGGGFLDEQGNWCLNAEKNLEAVRFITNLVKDGLTNADPTKQTRYELMERFGAGQIAMMIAPSSLPLFCADTGVNYAVAPIPAQEGCQPVTVGQIGRFLCFADDKRTPETLAAITSVVDAIYEDERYTAWALQEGYLPATTTGAALLGAQDPAMAAWQGILDTVTFYPDHHVQWPDVKDGTVNVLQQTVWGGDIWLLLHNLQKQLAG